MFLLDAQLVRGLIVLLFKIIENGQVIYKTAKLPYVYYILVKCTAPKAHEPYSKETVKGTIYNNPFESETTFQRVDIDDHSQQDFVIQGITKKCPHCKIYDCDLDYCARTLFEYGIEMYRFYEYDGFFKNGETLDPTKLIMISIENLKEKSLDTIKYLKVATVRTELSRKEDGNLLIPRIDDILKNELGMERVWIEYLIGYTTVTSISIHCEGKNYTIKSPNEKMLLETFCKTFVQVDADVWQWFNTSELHFIYQRCKHLGLDKMFIDSVNRHDFDLNIDSLLARSFETRYKWNLRCQSDCLLNYGKFSDETTQAGFKNHLVGRIVLNLYGMIPRKDDLLKINIYNTKDIHLTALPFLSLLLRVTGMLGLTADAWNKDIFLSQWIVYRFCSFRVVWPQLSKNSSEPKYEIDGAHIPDVQEGTIYRQSNTIAIIGIDMSSFYANNAKWNNLSEETRIPQKSQQFEKFKSQLNEINGQHYRKLKDRKGILPDVYARLLMTRDQLKDKMKNASDETKELYDIEQKGIKTITVTLYGSLGAQYSTNPMRAPEVAGTITGIGTEILISFIDFLSKMGHVVLSGHTDGVVIFTKYADKLKTHLLEFKEKCKYTCFPEIREQFKAILICNKKDWIGLGVNDVITNRDVIKTHISKFQRQVELELFHVLLTKKQDQVDQMLSTLDRILKEMVTPMKEMGCSLDDIHSTLFSMHMTTFNVNYYHVDRYEIFKTRIRFIFALVITDKITEDDDIIDDAIINSKRDMHIKVTEVIKGYLE